MNLHNTIHDSDLNYTALYFVVATYLALMTAFLVAI